MAHDPWKVGAYPYCMVRYYRPGCMVDIQHQCESVSEAATFLIQGTESGELYPWGIVMNGSWLWKNPNLVEWDQINRCPIESGSVDVIAQLREL